jgi:meso-butanediol dehydrogenase / (S,S)-butanediol dehydrogenase / diacetyl reductase
MQGLAGKAAIVTGASSGIGLAAARALVDAGASVLLVARRAERLDRAAAEIGSSAGDRVLARALDVTDDRAPQEAFEAAIAGFGGVDFLCNNAGRDGEGVDVAELSLDEWNRVLATNVTSALRFSQQLAGHLRERDATGAIVNVASINGLGAELHFADYNTSKGALIALTRSLAVDLAPRVRANAVCPGYVETEMAAQYLADPEVRGRIEGDIPLGRVGRPAEIGELIAFLFSDHASYLTGSTVVVDGGRTAGWKGGL